MHGLFHRATCAAQNAISAYLAEWKRAQSAAELHRVLSKGGSCSADGHRLQPHEVASEVARRIYGLADEGGRPKSPDNGHVSATAWPAPPRSSI